MGIRGRVKGGNKREGLRKGGNKGGRVKGGNKGEGLRVGIRGKG